MKVLALTHAHLNLNGLSPVSCERADSITGVWADKLHWDVDVIHTNNTKWQGIWPSGKGLKINIITPEAPRHLMMGEPQLFSVVLKTHLAKRKIKDAAALVGKRIIKRTHIAMAAKGMAMPYELSLGEKWGKYLLSACLINNKKYDFIFACIGYGDEYLLQTALTISQKLNIPMVVDFRDLWSEHHEPHRFTPQQRAMIRKQEIRLLKNTLLITAPQTQMITLLRKWVTPPVYQVPHSAYIEKSWGDGHVINDHFTMLYAGKLYPDGPGIKMLLELIKNLSQQQLPKPFTCRFFVDNTTKLKQMAADYGVVANISANEWISPQALWGEIRSAHLLVITDLGVSEQHPILPTKTFQYAYSGRRILCLFRYMETEMKALLEQYNAGRIYTNIAEATDWVKNITFEEEQYNSMPPLRNVPLRQDIAEQYGNEIIKVMNKG